MILVIYIFENLVYTGGFLGKQIGAEPGGPGGHQHQSIIRVSRAHALTSGRWLVERQWWIKMAKLNPGNYLICFYFSLKF